MGGKKNNHAGQRQGQNGKKGQLESERNEIGEKRPCLRLPQQETHRTIGTFAEKSKRKWGIKARQLPDKGEAGIKTFRVPEA